ncbi:MAG: toprim domain-containing protein [Thiolinea sp.]
MGNNPEMKKPRHGGAAFVKASTSGGVDSPKHNANQPPATTDPIDLIEKSCIDATGAAPPRHLILSKVGRWLRYSSTGKAKDKSCALKVIDKGDCYVFIIKDHRTGTTKTGSTRTGKRALMTAEEKAAAQRQRVEHERQRAERSARKHRMLSAAARRIWHKCLRPEQWEKPHPYLLKKQVPALNIRRFISHKRDVLVLPMINPYQGIMSLYLIDERGFKRPLKGSQTSGLCMAIGEDLSAVNRIWIAEGYATGVSLCQLTGDVVVVAFTAGNLLKVTEIIMQKYPAVEVKLCADDDRATAEKIGKNPGIEYAKAVQQRHPQIALYKPLFPPDAPQGLSDVNDLVMYERQRGGLNHG